MTLPQSSNFPSSKPIKIWLDCDPGHDDAVALLLALYQPEKIEVVGISTVNGNAPLLKTHINCAQILTLYEAPTTIPLHRGLAQPLVKAGAPPPTNIHGHTGLDGVVGLPPLSDPRVQAWHNQQHPSEPTMIRGLRDMLSSPTFDPKEGGKEKLTIVITGPCTNIAKFRMDHGELYEDRVEKVVVMGGALGIPQYTPYAEFNIATDPDALHILLSSPKVPLILVPLNLTHQAIFTEEDNRRLLDPRSVSRGNVTNKGGSQAGEVKAITPLRESLSTMLNFFRRAYEEEFGFNDGPPLHDPLTILYLSHPHLFTSRWSHLSVNTSLESPRNGETTAEFFVGEGEEEDWEDRGKYFSGEGVEKKSVPNCLVLEKLDRGAFIDVLMECVERADEKIASVTSVQR